MRKDLRDCDACGGRYLIKKGEEPRDAKLRHQRGMACIADTTKRFAEQVGWDRVPQSWMSPIHRAGLPMQRLPTSTAAGADGVVIITVWWCPADVAEAARLLTNLALNADQRARALQRLVGGPELLASFRAARRISKASVNEMAKEIADERQVGPTVSGSSSADRDVVEGSVDESRSGDRT